MLPNRSATSVLVGFFLVAFATHALAHHGEGMRVPTSLLAGAVGGVAHPVLDFAHLGFLLALGVFTLRSTRPVRLLLLFTVTTLLGAIVHLNGIEPLQGAGLALWVAASAMVAGAAVAWHARMGLLTLAALAIAGVLHGSAYAQSVEGATLPVLLAYFCGVVVTQAAIATASWFLLRLAHREAVRARVEQVVAGMAVLCGGIAMALVISQ